MTENEILKVLSENDGYFTQSSIITDALSNIGWVIICGFRKLVNGIDDILDQIYTVFGFSTSEPVQQFLEQAFPILICLMGLGVIYLGYCFMTNKIDNKTNIFRNFLLIVLVVTCLPIFVTQMNNITIGAIDAVRSTYTETGNIADDMITGSIVDLKYMDSNKFNFENTKKNNLTADTLSAIDITETVDPEDDTLKNKALFESYSVVDSGGSLKLEKIDYGGWLDIFPKFYYRYNVEWLTIFMLLISVGVALLFTCYKVARIIIDIAIHQFLAYLFAVTDFTSGQRLREVLKSMLSLFTVVFLTTVILKFYFLAQAYFKALCDAGTIGTFTYALLLVIAALAVIDGPNVIERILGVDAGIKSGYQTLIGGLALARGAASAGRLARNAAIGDPARNTKYDDKGNRTRELGGLFGGAKKAASGVANGAAKSAGIFSGFNDANKKAGTSQNQNSDANEQNKNKNGVNNSAGGASGGISPSGIDPNAIDNIIANDPLSTNIAMQPSGANESVASGIQRMGGIGGSWNIGDNQGIGKGTASGLGNVSYTNENQNSAASGLAGNSFALGHENSANDNSSPLISSENEKFDNLRRESMGFSVGSLENNNGGSNSSNILASGNIASERSIPQGKRDIPVGNQTNISPGVGGNSASNHSSGAAITSELGGNGGNSTMNQRQNISSGAAENSATSNLSSSGTSMASQAQNIPSDIGSINSAPKVSKVGVAKDVIKTIGKDAVTEKLNNSSIKESFTSGQQKGKYYQSVVDKAKKQYNEKNQKQRGEK